MPTKRMRRSAIQFFRSTAAVAAAVATTACPAQPEAVPPYGIADQEPYEEPPADDPGTPAEPAAEGGAEGGDAGTGDAAADPGNQEPIYGSPPE